MVGLEYGQIVTFRLGEDEYHYEVFDHFLSYGGRSYGGSNDAIFDALGISNHQKYLMASAAYGYQHNCGDWPAFRENDYEAAYRLVKELYDLCNIYNSKEK